jgi:NAD dependent epimerase/dehydratase family enzyme
VTNAELAATIGTALRRPTVVPIPAFGPRLVLGRERADTLLFEGQRVLPRVLQADGFTHAHPTLEPALRAVLRR